MGGGAANTAVTELADSPPPPTPPRHALTRAEGGEKKTNSIFKQHSAFPRRDAPEVLQNLCPSRQRAQGKPGVRCTRSRACSGGSTRVSHHEFTGNIRLSPRNGFNGLFRALPGDRALLPPSPLRSLLLKSLTPASGCQDHTTSPSASVSFARTLSCTDTVASTASRTQRP